MYHGLWKNAAGPELMRIIVVIGMLLCGALHAGPPELDEAAGKLIAEGAAGFSMALVDRNGMYWSDSFGFADREAQRPFTVNTVLNIASISKTITGSSLMILVEQGKLDLDRDINDFLPFRVSHPAYPGAGITTRQLLTHSSAIVDRPEIYNSETVYFPGDDNPISLGDFVAAYLSEGGRFHDPSNFAGYPPGTERQYSNIAYGLAGYLVERLSGQSLDRFSSDHIFTPLGMKSTAWMLRDIDKEMHARLYESGDQTLTRIEWYGLATWPDGGVRTSVSDLSRFIAAMIAGGQFEGTRIMKESTVSAMFQPQFDTGQVLEAVSDAEGQKQAITWSYRTGENGITVLGHGGSDPGVKTQAYFHRESGKGAVLLINTSSESESFNRAAVDLFKTLLYSGLN
jgi:CubicO group peptidase (beta-lactamase class C family)